jgi:putative addiction module component (TIGR02574 family)
MSTTADELVLEIRALPDAEKLRLLDAILTALHKPDPEIERVWAEEAGKRWAAYKAGRIPTVSYEDVMAKHQESVSGSSRSRIRKSTTQSSGMNNKVRAPVAAFLTN